MSLTQAETMFAGIHEDAINDFLRAFCQARPRYLHYGSPAFTPATTASETRIDAISFPGVPGGIQWRLRLSIPEVDLFEQSRPLPPQLALGPGQFAASVNAELCIECRKIRIDPRPPRPDGGQEPDRPVDDDKRPLAEFTCFKLDIFLLGHLEQTATVSSPGIVLAVDAVEIVDIIPDELESFLECLMFLILQAVMAGIRLPLSALRVSAFELTPTIGPLIEDNQVKARGTV